MSEPSQTPDHAAPLNARALEAHRAALTGHCYRMLGSASEADDAVQETMVRAWRALDRFEGRASLKTWLHRIATRVCLDAIADRKRARTTELSPVGTIEDALVPLPAGSWIEPIADAAVIPEGTTDPAELLRMRQSIRLAFVAALQHLPPKQRAALILAEVVEMPAAEIAETLETTVPAVNSALQRARATLATREVEERTASLSETQSQLLDRYVEAFERYDMQALTALLHEDATMCMPPFSIWLRGHESISAWMLGRGSACRGSRLVEVAACGSRAWGQYKPAPDGSGHVPWALVVVEPAGDRIAALTFFLDVEVQFPRFGLPPRL